MSTREHPTDKQDQSKPTPSPTIIQQILRRPILVLVRLRIQPNQAVGKEVIDDRLGSSALPVQIRLQHGDGYVVENLDNLEDGGLVCV